MDARLRRLDSNTKTKILEAPLNGTPKIWLAGRAACCHIYTRSKYASRKHFSITYRENKYYISDLQSSNGTFVDDNKITSEKVLSCGNVISVGVPLNVPKTPDVIIYVFEILSALIKKPTNKEDDDICIINETVGTCEKQINLTEGTDPKKKEVNINEDHFIIHLDENCVKFDNNSSETDNKNDKNEVEETTRNTSLTEVIVIAASNKTLKRSLNSSNLDHAPAKVQKFEELEETIQPFEESKKSYDKQPLQNKENVILDEEDMEVYEALTQIDKPEVKIEKSLLNYSGTEELIEISDSDEEDWPLKSLEKKKCDELPEGEEDDDDGDDDVVFIERIIKSKNNDDLPSLVSKIQDDLTETDKKWMGKLLKVKDEQESFSESQSEENIQSVEITEEYNAVCDGSLANEGVPTADKEPSGLSVPATVSRCSVKLQTVSEDHFRDGEPEKSAGSFVEQEKTFQKSSKKSVSFDLNPKIRYYEVPKRLKFTNTEKGLLSLNKIIFNICNWNTVWLEECKRVASEKDPPDICDAPFRKIPKKFKSHADYLSSYVPVMLLHLWHKIKDKWKNSGEAAFRQTVSCNSYEDYPAKNLWLLKCTGLVQSVEAHLQLVKEGHLVMLRLHPVRGANAEVGPSKYFKNVGYLVFGYLKAKTYERFYGQPVHEALRERCSSSRGDLHLVKLTILVKKRQRLEIDKQKLMQMTVVQNISSDMRIFRAICFLPLSPLFETILRPAQTKFVLTATPENTKVFFKGPMDEHQKQLVSNLTHAFSSKDSFLFSIHGAAGTGKSQVVVAFILELLCGKESKKIRRPKIIYCAPSDGPLDEMVSRLKSCRESLDVPSRFSMARVGPIKGVKPEVREFALTNLTQKYQSSKLGIKSGRNEDSEVEILEKSDVICAACSPTGMKKIIWVFNNKLKRNRNQKTVCIIDEANNIRESESLLPLLVGVTHLLLVGDRHQVDPPFSGKKTRFLGLDMPLFDRICKNLEVMPRDLWPVSVLQTQYRMSIDLSRFVGNVVYGVLLGDSVASASHKIPTLRSYRVLVNEAQDVDPNTTKIQEGRIVLELVRAVLKVTKEEKEKALNLSVITSDPRQTEVIQSFMPKREFPKVEINEVEKYQGRETDVVVFSCDGTRLLDSQIAVAITRARSSLFIVTTERSISINPMCQKLARVAEENKALNRIGPNSEPEIFERVVAE